MLLSWEDEEVLAEQFDVFVVAEDTVSAMNETVSAHSSSWRRLLVPNKFSMSSLQIVVLLKGCSCFCVPSFKKRHRLVMGNRHCCIQSEEDGDYFNMCDAVCVRLRLCGQGSVRTQLPQYGEVDLFLRDGVSPIKSSEFLLVTSSVGCGSLFLVVSDWYGTNLLTERKKLAFEYKRTASHS